MASPTLTFDALCKQLADKKYAPVYLIHGEVGYYADALAERFDAILDEDEKAFNQYTFYAPQVQPGEVADACMGVPMMAERQVVIVKEAQAVDAAWLNKLAPYASHPNRSTVLCICCRGAAAKGRELVKAVQKTGVVFESKRIWDNQLPAMISSHIVALGMTPDPKAVAMLAEFIGTDLSRLYNEIDKLAVILGRGAMVTPEAVERNIGVSKDYNSFELVDALAAKDSRRVFQISAYFQANPKSNPAIMVIATLFGFFADLLSMKYAPDKSDRGYMELLHLKAPVQLRRYTAGNRNYSARSLISIIDALRRYDCMCKGAGSRQDANLLLHDLLYRILTA